MAGDKPQFPNILHASFMRDGEVTTELLIVWSFYLQLPNDPFSSFSEQLMELMHSRARRRFSRGLKRKPMALVKKLREAKKEAPPNEKPEIVKTHLRNMLIVPEMVGSIVGVYNGKTFNQVTTY